MSVGRELYQLPEDGERKNGLIQCDRLRIELPLGAGVELRTELAEEQFGMRGDEQVWQQGILAIPPHLHKQGLITAKTKKQTIVLDISPKLLPSYPDLFNRTNILSILQPLSEVVAIEAEAFQNTARLHYLELTEDIGPLNRPKKHYLASFQTLCNPRFRCRVFSSGKVLFFNFLDPETVQYLGIENDPLFKLIAYDKGSQIRRSASFQRFLTEHPRRQLIEDFFNATLRFELKLDSWQSIRFFFRLPIAPGPPLLFEVLNSDKYPLAEAFNIIRGNQSDVVLDSFPATTLSKSRGVITQQWLDALIIRLNYDIQLVFAHIRAIFKGRPTRLERLARERIRVLKTTASQVQAPLILNEIDSMLAGGF